MNMRSRIENLINDAVSRTGMTKTELLTDARINTAHFYDAMKGKRPFSDKILKGFSDSAYFPVTYHEMLAWRAIDEYPEEVLELALQVRKRRDSINMSSSADDSESK